MPTRRQIITNKTNIRGEPLKPGTPSPQSLQTVIAGGGGTPGPTGPTGPTGPAGPGSAFTGTIHRGAFVAGADDALVARDLQDTATSIDRAIQWLDILPPGNLSARPAADTKSDGALYFAKDIGITFIQRAGHWWYFSGVQSFTLDPLDPTRPSVDNPYDIGYQIYSEDFDWCYRFDGTNWVRQGGASRFIQLFMDAPTRPGWGLCDGSTYTASTDDAATEEITSPALTTGGKFLKFGATYNGSVAAVAPTGNMPNHAHAASGLATAGAKSSSGATWGAPSAFLFGGSVNAASHNHSVTATGSLTGSISANLPNHRHVASDIATAGAKTSGGATWGAAGHFTTETALSVSGTTDEANLNHSHGFTWSGSTGGPDGSSTVFADGGASAASSSHAHTYSGSNTTNDALGSHSHGFYWSGDATTIVSANTNHYHIMDSHSGLVEDNPVAISFTNTMGFSGSSATTSSEAVGIDISGLQLTVQTDHYHILDTISGLVVGSPLALTLTAGAPAAVVLLPYIRL